MYLYTVQCTCTLYSVPVHCTVYLYTIQCTSIYCEGRTRIIWCTCTRIYCQGRTRITWCTCTRIYCQGRTRTTWCSCTRGTRSTSTGAPLADLSTFQPSRKLCIQFDLKVFLVIFKGGLLEVGGDRHIWKEFLCCLLFYQLVATVRLTQILRYLSPAYVHCPLSNVQW